MLFSKSFAEWTTRGDSAVKEKDYDEALRCYEKAVEQDDSAAVGWLNLGRLLVLTKDHPVMAHRAMLRARQILTAANASAAELGLVQREIDQTDWAGLVSHFRLEPSPTALKPKVGGLLTADTWGFGPNLAAAVEQFVPSTTGLVEYGGSLKNASWKNVRDPQDGIWYFETKGSVSISNYLWRTCRAALFFRFEGDRRAITTRDPRYAAQDGSLTVQEELVSAFQFTSWNEVTLRLPVQRITEVLAPGEWRMEALFCLIAPDKVLDTAIMPLQYKVG